MIEANKEQILKNQIPPAIKSRQQLALESAISCVEYIDFIFSTINKITSLFQSNKTAQANKEFVQLTEMLELMLILITKILNTCNASEVKNIQKLIDSYSLNETHLTIILKNIFTAHQQENISMICDLLEYELKDNLKKWHRDNLKPMIQQLENKQNQA